MTCQKLMTNQSFLASIQFTSGRDGTGSAPVPTCPAGQHRTPTQTCGAASRTYTSLALAEFNLILLLQLLVSCAERVGMTVKSARQFSCAGQSLARPELRKQDCWMRASPFLTTVRDRFLWQTLGSFASGCTQWLAADIENGLALSSIAQT
jgi:hypothetical protein